MDGAAARESRARFPFSRAAPGADVERFGASGGRAGRMGKLHKVRDPVHNFVQLGEDEVKLVDTPIFQRLRGIRQLAMANLVYPGALHTRFDHSLGVCHVAGLMAEELSLPD